MCEVLIYCFMFYIIKNTPPFLKVEEGESFFLTPKM